MENKVLKIEKVDLNEELSGVLAIARRASEDSPDRSRKTGAVIIKDGKILTTGCNTLPEGVPHRDEYLERPLKYDWTEHAERNAIFAAAMEEGVSTKDACMVAAWFPCKACARAIASSGISEFVSPMPDLEDPTWGDEFKLSLEIFRQKGVKFTYFEDNAPPMVARASDDPAEMIDNSHRPSIEEVVKIWNEHGVVALEYEDQVKPRARKVR